ncbi:MAG TPA: SRPBCC domain-containing protein [Polyangiaceae bacterium]|nr:SRPBCC domain-containing protein [Polyangiaceae bacterium]
MSNLGKALRVPAARFERMLPGPIERMWEHLTDCTKLKGWFGEGTIEPHEGGAVTLMGGDVRGVITQWKPPRLLAYTWNVFGPQDEESPFPESYLTFELEARGDQVLLTLTHMPILERFEKQNMMGWHTFLDMVEAALSSQTPEPQEVHMKRNAERYGVDLANLAR